ncbi:MAG: DUF2330 domain-containing protein [Planctomycetes bacterium]|nr:DUF2330 domain-containing protein [Planctomycetota bacterium]
MSASRLCLVGATLAVLLPSAQMRGDRGGIPLGRSIKVFEPGQRAIAAWRDGKEVLILAADVRASGDTRVVEIMPFPSRPQVGKADLVGFVYLEYLADRTFRREVNEQILSAYRFHGGSPESPGIEIASHQKIGAHEITVVDVREAAEFTTWFEDFLGRQGAETKLPEELEKLIGDYLEDGFRHFAIDVIEVRKDTRSVEPIAYRFDSKRLFYPLRISSLYGGETEITLATITSRRFGADRLPEDFEPLVFVTPPMYFDKPEPEKRRIELPPIALAPRHLEKFAPEIREMYRGRGAVLQVWTYSGPLNVPQDVSVSLDGETADASQPATETLSPESSPLRRSSIVFCSATAEGTAKEDPAEKTAKLRALWSSILPEETLSRLPGIADELVSADRTVRRAAGRKLWDHDARIAGHLAQRAQEDSTKRGRTVEDLCVLMRHHGWEHDPRGNWYAQAITRVLGRLGAEHGWREVVPAFIRLLEDEAFADIRISVPICVLGLGREDLDAQKHGRDLFSPKDIETLIRIGETSKETDLQCLAPFARALLARRGDRKALEHLIEMLSGETRTERELGDDHVAVMEAVLGLARALLEYPIEKTLQILESEEPTIWLQRAAVEGLARRGEIDKLAANRRLESLLAEIAACNHLERSRQVARRLLYRLWDAEERNARGAQSAGQVH